MRRNKGFQILTKRNVCDVQAEPVLNVKRMPSARGIWGRNQGWKVLIASKSNVFPTNRKLKVPRASSDIVKGRNCCEGFVCVFSWVCACFYLVQPIPYSETYGSRSVKVNFSFSSPAVWLQWTNYIACLYVVRLHWIPKTRPETVHTVCFRWSPVFKNYHPATRTISDILEVEKQRENETTGGVHARSGRGSLKFPQNVSFSRPSAWFHISNATNIETNNSLPNDHPRR